VNWSEQDGSLARSETDWYKVYVPTLSSNATLEVVYTGAPFTPHTALYRGLRGNAGADPSKKVAEGDGTTFTYTVTPGYSNQWYWVLVSGSAGGSYTIEVNLKRWGAKIEEDWSDPASNRYALAYSWGDMVADGLDGGDADGFEVYLSRGYRFSADIAPEEAPPGEDDCDTKVAVYAPPLDVGPWHWPDYFGDDPFIWDSDNHGADSLLGAYSHGDSVTFVAPRDGVYEIDVEAGPGGCSSSYRAYFAITLDEPDTYLPPPFGKVPG
jgi:hypothetical protein